MSAVQRFRARGCDQPASSPAKTLVSTTQEPAKPFIVIEAPRPWQTVQRAPTRPTSSSAQIVRASTPLAHRGTRPHAPDRMFCVSEVEATAIRTAYEQKGELAAAIEVRRLFPGITDNANARTCARVIAGWKPLPAGEAPVGDDPA